MTDGGSTAVATTPSASPLEALRECRASGSRPPRDLRGARLVGEDLSGLDLSGCDLSGADLSRADLTGAKLMGAKLREAVLFEAALGGAEFLSADLTGADLSQSQADRAGFGGADLTGATLFRCSLQDAAFTKATLRGCDLRTARLEGARLREADLRECDFSQADLRATDIERSHVDGASFNDADLRRARVRGLLGYATASWIGADILDVDFCGAYLVRRSIMDQNYLYEFRTQSRVHAGLYWVWWVTSDCGRSFVRWALWTVFLAALFAELFEFVELDYGDHPTPLSSLYYSLVTLTTLGYGDVVPASLAAQIIAMVEVVLGYVMLGGLLSIFANKMARRAD